MPYPSHVLPLTRFHCVSITLQQHLRPAGDQVFKPRSLVEKSGEVLLKVFSEGPLDLTLKSETQGDIPGEG